MNLKSKQFVYIQVVAGLRRSLVSSVPAARQQHVVGDYLSTEQITLLQQQLHTSDIIKTEKVKLDYNIVSVVKFPRHNGIKMA